MDESIKKKIEPKPRLLAKARPIILRSLRKGDTHNAASIKAGIHITTLAMWLRKGEENKDDPKNVYTKFAHEVEKAKLDAEELILQKILEGSTEVRREVNQVTEDGKVIKTMRIRRTPSWRQAAWMLERRYPEKYAAHHFVTNQNKEPETQPEATDATNQLYGNDEDEN